MAGGMGFGIRLATNADGEGIVDVVRSVFDEYGFTWDEDAYNADLYDVEAHYLSHGNPFWVAEDESGRIFGTGALELYEKLPGQPGSIVEVDGRRRAAGSDCSMERLYVHPDARRMGIGRALACTIVEEARRRGRTAMELWSDKRLTKAHTLYQSMGATVIGDRICHDPDQSPEWGLLLPLV